MTLFSKPTYGRLILLAASILGFGFSSFAEECLEERVVNSNAVGDNVADSLPDIASDGSGNVVAVWIADSIPGISGSGPEIYWARSNDWGTTWSARSRVTDDTSFDIPRDWDPVVEADPDGNFVIAWESNSVLDGTLGTDIDIMMVRSSDGGQTWAAPSPLNSSAATDGNKVDAAPDIFRASNGTWICAFSSTQSMGSYWDVRLWVSRSTDAGQTWSVETSVFTSRAYHVLYPSISGDGAGNWIVAWYTNDSLSSQIGSDEDLLLSRSNDDGLTWTAPAPLNPHAWADSAQDAWVRIAPAGGGAWNAVWHSSYRTAPQANGAANNILLSRSLDNGATWSAAVGLVAQMDTDARNDTYPSMIQLGSGALVAAWASKPTTADPYLGSDSDILNASSTDGGETWTYRGALNAFATANDRDDLHPLLANGAEGRFLATWMSSTNVGGTIGTDNDIFMTSVCETTPTPSPTPSPSATPTPSATPSPSPSESPTPSVTPSPSLTQTPSLTPSASPTESPSLTPTPSPSPSQTPSLTPSPSPSETPSLPISNTQGCAQEAVVNSNASGDNKSDNLQDLASDSAGNVVAVWVADNIAGLAGSGPEIYLAHSSDWGATWSTRARATTDPSFNTPRDWDPVVESDPDGNFVIAWESNSVLDGTLGTDIDIMKIRSSDGGVTWSSPMPLNLSAATDGNKVDAAPDIFRAPNGTWICAFSSTQSMGSYWDVRLWVSRSTDAGQTWSSEVSVFTSRAYSVLYPSVSGDADGNWIVSWHSPDSLGGQIGTDDDILFSRSGNDGLTWTAPRALNTHAGSDASNDAWVKIAPAGGGVWNAVWYSSYRLAPQANGTANNILLSRSLDNGITWSPATGIVAEMNSDSRNDSYPVIIRLNSGVWITAWPSKPTTADPSLGSDSDILYASSMDEGQTWNYQGALNIFADENDADDLFPMLAHGPAGKFLTIWSSGTNVSGLIQTDPDIFMSSVCQPTPTPSPTPSPSLTPTEIPTVTPTESPTRTPSLTPTASPVPDYDGAVVDVIFPPAVLPVQRHPIHVRMRNTGLATWTSADPVTLAAEDDPCDLLRGEALFLPPDLTVAPGGEALFRGWINTPDTPGDCPLTLRLTAAAPGSFGEAVELSFTVGDKLEIQLLTDWWGGAIAGSGQPIQPDTGGMCMVAPQSGDNILAWISPESYAQLVDLDVYRIRLDAATDQQTPDAIPLWDITYDNFTSGIGITYGGEIIFLDVAGGAQGIGRQQGRGVFELWAAPNAFLTPQWRGVTGDPAADANGAFTPQADAINDMRLLFRILDLDSAGVLADQDFGTICINRVRIDRMPFSAIGAEETLWAPPINSATHLAQRNDQMGAGMAIIDDAGARARYALLEGTPDPVSGLAPGSRKTLFPFEAAIYDPATPYAYAPFFPVQWTGDTLYMAEVWIESEAAPGAQPDPVDTVFVNLDVTTTELVSINVSLRGAPDIMNQAASPRRGAVAGGPQRFVGFMHSHNPAAVDLNAVPNADRLRAQADFINVPQIAPYAAGADPFSVTGLAVKRILTPFPLGEE